MPEKNTSEGVSSKLIERRKLFRALAMAAGAPVAAATLMARPRSAGPHPDTDEPCDSFNCSGSYTCPSGGSHTCPGEFGCGSYSCGGTFSCTGTF